MNRNPNAADIKPVKRVTFSEISYFIISSSTNMSKKYFHALLSAAIFHSKIAQKVYM